MERIYQRSIPFGVPTTTTTLFDSSERERGGEGTGGKTCASERMPYKPVIKPIITRRFVK